MAYAQIASAPTAEKAKKVGSIIDQTGVSLGSCFYIDQRGYVATAFSNVERTSKLIVAFNDGNRFSVTGFVAACRGKDIVILALRDVPNRVLPLTLREADLPDIGDHLMRWGGPMAEKTANNSSLTIQQNNLALRAKIAEKAANRILANNLYLVMPTASIGESLAPVLRSADSSMLVPTLARKLYGDEYLMGVSDPPEWTIGHDPDLQWLWLDQACNRSCSGGPVFDNRGHVVAMVSGSLDKRPEIVSAISTKHVLDLIPVVEPKPRPLLELRKWVDPIPVAEALLELTENSLDLGGLLYRGRPLVERYRDLQRRLSQAEQEEAEIAKTHARTLARNLEIAPQIEKLIDDIATVSPEESYQTREKKTRKVKILVKKGKVDANGIKEPDEYETGEEEYTEIKNQQRFSVRQLAMLQPMKEDWERKQAELVQNKESIAFLSHVRMPFIKRLCSRLREEIFYLADPLGLRSREEHESYVNALTESIEEGGAPGIVYLLRGMSRTTLGEYDKARLDLAEAVDADPSLKVLAPAVEARCKIRSGEVDVGDKAMALAISVSKKDPRVLMIAARGALDRRNMTNAARYLTLAAPTCPDPAELKLGLAWIAVTDPTSSIRIALDNAEAAVRLTAGCDWSALSALAAAHARAKSFDLATTEIEAAVRLASDVNSELCRAWQSQIADKKPIERDWK